MKLLLAPSSDAKDQAGMGHDFRILCLLSGLATFGFRRQ